MADERRHGAETAAEESVAQAARRGSFYGGMFGDLPTFRPESGSLRELADKMKEGERAQARSGDNPSLPAGYTYLGQFVDHDLTLDTASTLDRFHDPERLRNFRTPRFDLDSLYGRGPRRSPALYDPDANNVKLLVGRNPKNEGFERDDLPRNQKGIALIGDHRNDENIIVSQLHLAFIHFHNKVVNQVRDRTPLTGRALFKEAHRLVRWHYQWIVVHDFLVRLVGRPLVDDILKPQSPQRVNLRFFHPGRRPFMPIEFSVAAYRWGHSAVRVTYSINRTVQDLPIFSQREKPGPLEAFHGFRRLPALWTVSWPFFFKLDNRAPQPSRKIDTKLAKGLFNLPGESGDMESLALRNLRRGWRLRLPSGARVAKAMSVKPLTERQLGIKHPAPLWFYVLREAELLGQPKGQRLGPVGGRIVAETFLGLLAADPLSYLSVEPDWSPGKERLGGKAVKTMPDLLRFAAPEQAKRF